MHMPAGDIVVGSIEKLAGVISAPIGWLVFNNPERRNAVSLEMWQAITPIMTALEADPRVRVIVVTGTGGKAFIAGADISEFDKTRSTADANADYRRQSGASAALIANSAKPTIAMIRGACIGGGLATALNCDLRIADPDAKFGIPAARLGIGYPFVGMQRLVALVGPANAKLVMFTARHFTAAQALGMGLVNEVAEDNQLEAHVAVLADTIAANAPLSIHAAKLAIDMAVRDPDARDLDRVATAVAAAMGSADFKEGSRAFLEKRPPQFTGS